jgi:CheY-specific phosphatase CheX
MSTAPKKAESPREENPLFQENVINALCVGLQETITMMAQVKITFGKPSIELSWKTTGDVSGVVEFETKDFRGSVYIHFPGDVLIKLYNQMVGESLTTVSPEVVDCIGEISNMAYGVAKGKLDPLQLKFTMSLPKTFKTTDLNRLATVPHLLIPFNAYDKECQLEITLGMR